MAAEDGCIRGIEKKNGVPGAYLVEAHARDGEEGEGGEEEVESDEHGDGDPHPDGEVGGQLEELEEGHADGLVARARAVRDRALNLLRSEAGAGLQEGQGKGRQNSSRNSPSNSMDPKRTWCDVRVTKLSPPAYPSDGISTGRRSRFEVGFPA